MSAIVRPDEEECYLYAILAGAADGIDLAEFAVEDPRNPGGRYRVRDYQWPYMSCTDKFQIDQSGRNVGKTESVKLRCLAFPFVFPGKSALMTAPTLSHLRPLTDEVQKMLLHTWITRQMMPNDKAAGIARTPAWQCLFKNGTSLISRLPQLSGDGLKGMHVILIEVDESQDVPEPAWTEIVDCLNESEDGAIWRCVAAEQLVLTDAGFVPIEKVQVGDLVWTHRNRWRRVLNVFDNGFQECISISGRGHHGLVVTPAHKFYIGDLRRQKRGRKRFHGASWKAIRDVASNRRRQDAWASPAALTSRYLVPDMNPGIGKIANPGDPRWLWLYGLYLAEGYGINFDQKLPSGRFHRHRRVSWCVNDEECDHVAARLAELGFRSHFYRQGRSVKVIVSNAACHDWLVENSGRLAHGKRLAPWVFGLDHAGRQAVFDGMVYGDGFFNQKRLRHEYATVSRDLAFGFKLLAQSLGYICSVGHNKAADGKIGDRVIKTGECWTIYAQLAEDQKRSQSIVADGMVWAPVNPERDFKPAGVRHVFDLEVEDDHSYVVEGVVVSNCHGVTTGVRNAFWKMTQPGSGWTVHRYMAMHRDTWCDEERESKIKKFDGSRSNPGYRRNVYGDHCDAANSVFLLANLVARTDLDDGSIYNSEVYRCIRISGHAFNREAPDDERASVIRSMIEIPASHFQGYSQKVGGREVGSPRGYSAYWAGADIGLVNDPTEVLLAGARYGEDLLEIILRIQMKEINSTDQKLVIQILFDTYGESLKGFGMDSTGVGRPIWDELTRYPFGSRVHGYNFGAKYIESFEERQLRDGETMKDLARERLFKELSTDLLRNRYVDGRRIRFPNDNELTKEWGGVTYHVVLDPKDPYTGQRKYSGGSLHTLDAGRCLVGAIHIPPLEAMLEVKEEQAPVFDYFPGAMTW
jgi:hypothetical protein